MLPNEVGPSNGLSHTQTVADTHLIDYLLNEQGSYWVANTFIWNWLLLPILPLNELIKQDIASNLQTEDKKPVWLKLVPYLTSTGLSLLLWLISIPGWEWFIITILKSDQPNLVLDLIKQLVPCYAFFTIGSLFNGILYALGRTDYLALKSFMGNCLIVVLFMLFSYGIWFKSNVFAVASIFGSGLVFGSGTSALFLGIALWKKKFIL